MTKYFDFKSIVEANGLNDFTLTTDVQRSNNIKPDNNRAQTRIYLQLSWPFPGKKHVHKVADSICRPNVTDYK